MNPTGQRATSDTRAKLWLDATSVLESYGIYVALLLVGIIAGILSPGFYTPSNIFNVLRQAATLGMVSVGQTFVILGGGIDLSVGGVMGTATMIVGDLSQGQDTMLFPIVILCLAVGGLVGLINGLLVTKRNVPPFVGTLGMLIAIEGARLAYTKGIPSGAIPPFLRVLGRDSTGPVPNSLIILVLIIIAGSIALYMTGFGRAVYATGGNREVARLSGIGSSRPTSSQECLRPWPAWFSVATSATLIDILVVGLTSTLWRQSSSAAPVWLAAKAELAAR